MNSEEIAKLANVSRSTVSRVINNYKNVPLETREKVQRVIDEYGYTPNISARTLAGKANNIIGLFIADINTSETSGQWIGTNSPYNAELLSHVIGSCKRRGYLTLVYTVTDLAECEEMEQYFSNRMLFGGIFIGFPYRTKELEVLAEKGHNIVLIDQLSEQDDEKKKYKLINSENVMGGYCATEYLIQNGHKKIAHVTGDYRLSSLDREKGYRNALEAYKLPVNSSYIVNGAYREDVAFRETKKLLEQEEITAIFVANDIMALGVIRAITELGKKVPEDISLIGFDNLGAAEWMHLNLTSMSVDLSELAEKSVANLFAKDMHIHSVCNPKLIEKESVKHIE